MFKLALHVGILRIGFDAVVLVLFVCAKRLGLQLHVHMYNCIGFIWTTCTIWCVCVSVFV